MKEMLMLKMIELYGFEDENTIFFCRLCENEMFSLETLRSIVEVHEKVLSKI